MSKTLSLAERLVVAADFSPKKNGGIAGAKKAFRSLLKNLSSGLYVTIKVNSMLRLVGYELIDEIHQAGLRCFADLKLFDIPQTLSIDGEFLEHYQPELVTVACHQEESMRALRQALPAQTEVLAVTTLTSEKAVKKNQLIEVGFAAKEAGLDGLILSGKELKVARTAFKDQLTLNVPGIRPDCSEVENDDQKRIVTPELAMLAGADRIIVGRPITQSKDPRSAVLRILDEIYVARQKCRNGRNGNGKE